MSHEPIQVPEEIGEPLSWNKAALLALGIHFGLVLCLLLSSFNWPWQSEREPIALGLQTRVVSSAEFAAVSNINDSLPITEPAVDERQQQIEAERQRRQQEREQAQAEEREREAQLEIERQQQQEQARLAQQQEQDRAAEAERERQALEDAANERREAAERERLKQQVQVAQDQEDCERLLALAATATDPTERQRIEALAGNCETTKIENERLAELERVREQRRIQRDQQAQLQREQDIERERELAQIRAERQAAEERTSQAQQQLDDLQDQPTLVAGGAPSNIAAVGRLGTLREQYAAAIQATVRGGWLRPPTATENFSCIVRIVQRPGGEVIDATIAGSCNVDAATQRSVIAAVKRNYLPYDGYEEVFERDINFTFTDQ